MVDLARELDDEEEQETAEKAPKKRSSVMKIILIILGVVILIGGGTAAALYFTGNNPFNTSQSSEEDTEQAQESSDKGKNAKYFAVEPPFVVNYAAENQLRFLQVSMEVMAYDQSAINAVEKHLPVIRNNMVMLLSSQDAKALFSLEGKQRLRQKALEEIQKILKERTGKKGVEEVFFTSFVMQ